LLPKDEYGVKSKSGYSAKRIRELSNKPVFENSQVQVDRVFAAMSLWFVLQTFLIQTS